MLHDDEGGIEFFFKKEGWGGMKGWMDSEGWRVVYRPIHFVFFIAVRV